ncbi:acid phosphatase det1, partial [Dermatophagoides farinae]
TVNEIAQIAIKPTGKPTPTKILVNRRKTLRRSLSYDTLPKMKNKMIICQPMTIQRRITVPPTNKIIFTTHKTQHLVLICLAFISFTSMLAMAIIAPFFPTESAKKGMRESVNGLVFSVYAFVFMICSPIISLMIPFRNIHSILFYCANIRSSRCGTAFSTSTYTILMEEFPDNVGTAFSIVETSVGLGLSLGPAIGGFLYNIGGYGLPFYVLGTIMLVNIPLCYNISLLLLIDCERLKSPMNAYFRLLSIIKVIINCCVIVVVAQSLSYLDPTIEPHLRSIGLGTNLVSLIFLILSATYTLSSPFIGWISQMVPNKFQIMAIGLLLMGLEFLFLGPAKMIPMETNFTQTAIVMALIGISYSIAFIPTFETLNNLALKNGFPDDVTTYSLVSGFWTSFCSLGEILGPMFGGFLTENFGFKQSSTIMGIIAIIMAFVCGITCIYYDELDTHDHNHKNRGNQRQKSLPQNRIISNRHHGKQSLARPKNILTNNGKQYESSEMIPLFPKRKRPRNNIVHRLFDREYNLHPRFHPFVFNNKLHQNVVPNFSIERAEHPNCFLRKFTYDGRYLMAFSSDITSVELYEYQGAAAAAQLLHLIPSGDKDYLSYGDENAEIRRKIFSCFFKRRHTITVAMDGGQLSRECSLFTDDNRFLIVASISSTSEATTSFHDRYQTNESIPMSHRSTYEDYKFHIIDIDAGRVVDSIEFKTDKIQIANNHGIYLYKNVFAILSVQHQIIHLYYILPNGEFIFNRKIGRFCSEEDRLLFEDSLIQSMYRRLNQPIPVSHRPVAAFREIPFNALKHRIITFAFLQAKRQSIEYGSPKPLCQFYHDFDYLVNLRMLKMQLLDEEHLLIKYEQEYSLVTYNQFIISKYDTYNQTKLWNLFVVYNWKTTEVINIYPQHSQTLLYAYENFCNYFRHPYGYYPCSPSNNYYAHVAYEVFKQSIIENRNGNYSEAVRCILSLLPHHAQLLTPSPYLDLSLFSYDEKVIGLNEKPRHTSDEPIRFFNRNTDRLSFRMHTGQPQRLPPLLIPLPNNRRLIAFIFHPTDPFIISVQRYNSQYLLYFHIRHFNPL